MRHRRFGADNGTIHAEDAQAKPSAGADSIKPFRIHFPDEALADLKRRIVAMRWPDKEPSRISRRACSWRRCRSSRAIGRTEYDWRKVEARLNALPQFITKIDGVDIHFIHVRSKQPNALPIIVTHGWPGSIIEQLKIIDSLTNPTAHGGSASDAFDVVIPSLPGHGFSAAPDGARLGSHPHRKGVGRADEAPRIHTLRGAGR